MLDKRGWIKIVEAFVAVLLTAGVLLVVIGESNIVTSDPSSEIYDAQLVILRDIQMGASLRQSVLNAVTPVDSSEAGFPEDVKARIEYLKPSNFECSSKICAVGAICNLDTPSEKSIYVQSTIISATLTDYNPKQLKLFCWRK